MDIVLRAIVLYVFVIFVMRVIGRRELSSMTPFDLVLLIILGDAIQQGLTQDDYSVTGAILAIGTIASLQVLTSYLSFRFPPLSPWRRTRSSAWKTLSSKEWAIASSCIGVRSAKRASWERRSTTSTRDF